MRRNARCPSTNSGQGYCALPWLGQQAYPLFLSHFLGQWIVGMTWGGSAHNRFFYTQAMLVSVGLAFLVALFQEWIDRKRYAYRGFGRVTGR